MRQDGVGHQHRGHTCVKFACLFQKTRPGLSAHDLSPKYVSTIKGGNHLLILNAKIIERIFKPFSDRQNKLLPEHSMLQDSLLSALSTDRDLYMTKIELTERKPTREAVSLHTINHVMR